MITLDNDNNREVKYYLDITFTINNCKYKKEKYKKIEINNKNDLSLFLLKKLYFLIFNSKHQLFLPVSRTGFLLLKDLIIQKSISTLWYNPYDLSRKIDLTLPIKNFFEQLSIILKKNDSFSFGIQIKENIKYENIISLIEKNILEGEICIENTLSILPMNAFPLSQYNTLDTIREIFYKTNNSDNNFSMHVSSAVVTEVTPIALFLKYGIDYNNIIMEEPEISLHPELQQQLTRVFIKLVNINTHVLITTHSDTIIQHINNMIKLNSNNEERKKYLMHKYGYDDDDLISEDKVRMYQFDINKEDGFTKVTKLESSEYGFEVPTFNKVLKKISDEIYDFQEEL
ncbi:AAA family ATPase [uncultured Brachyspira sp.]|uniref:AAA family ATPase n=1 Tax=uncultured Brachyspira sp. TaxID=221953 RepID=UPI00261AE853|nr:AAA family ATPase [uncultured Brachyspira sp.]